MAFLEERLDEKWAFGSSRSESYAVDVVETFAGNEYRKLNHPFPKARIDLNFENKTEAYLWQYIEDLFHRSGGRFGGFRAKNPSHFSTNNSTDTPTYNDQACSRLEAGVYQAMYWYGTESDSTAPRRRLLKIVSGTMLVGIRDDFNNPSQINQTGASPERWAVDNNTGQITFKANQNYSVTNITLASQAEITIGSHDFVTGDSVHVSVVSGMTEINGRRGEVQSTTSTTIVVSINSSGFSSYSSGGEVNTRPQDDETVTCGCQFDLPVRFEQDIAGIAYSTKNSEANYMSVGIALVEILNPS